MSAQIKSKQQTRIVVVGNGMVGHHFVDQLIQHNANVAQDGQAIHICVLSAEPRLAYDRVHLSEYFSGKTAEELALTTPQYYQQNQVEFKLDAAVVDIDKQAKTVTTVQG
ncbi:MAG: nitrite reductase (NAD(P)H), partial [Paraglaciecola sp.]|nr:nitrite reductase (NAD(P)H) [Paraglaciecola sp.]